MKAKLLYVWFSIRYSFWFVPALGTFLAIGLSFLMVRLDVSAEDGWMRELTWLYVTGPEGSRAVLATIAGSMIGVAGVVFSITIVTLTLASSQFGPRLLRHFMRDTGNQVVLATFVSTYVYCLLVLRTIQSADETSFVPTLSVAVGVVLALLSLGVLIFFFHHVSTSIQANNIIAAVSRDIGDTVERLFPDMIGKDPSEAGRDPEHSNLPPDFDFDSRPVVAAESEYLQAVHADELVKLASEEDLVIRIEMRPGQFTGRQSVLARVWPGNRLTQELEEDVRSAFLFGIQPTHEQDPAFAFGQLVEIAVRALSPGINDPFTAATCVDWLGSGLGQLAGRRLPSPYRYDHEGALRVVAPQVTFCEIADAVFTEIRQYGGSSIIVTSKVLDTIKAIAPLVRRRQDREALLRHADLMRSTCRENLDKDWDRSLVEDKYQAARKALHSDS